MMRLIFKSVGFFYLMLFFSETLLRHLEFNETLLRHLLRFILTYFDLSIKHENPHKPLKTLGLRGFCLVSVRGFEPRTT